MTLSDREIFTYIAVSVQQALVFEDLDNETRTRILIKMVENFCPTLTYKDWIDVFYSVEELKDKLSWKLLEIVEKKDYIKIAEKHLKAFNYKETDYQAKLQELNINIDQVKERLHFVD